MSASASTAAPSAKPKASGMVVATKIFIDEVSEYKLLPKCAEPRVSSIVRLMSFGCGDGSQMTSYACFCYTSSTYYSSIIGAQVATACDDQSQVTSAQDVFNKYCQIGQTRGVTPTTVFASPTSAAAQTIFSTPASSITSGLESGSSAPTLQTPPASSPTPTSSSSSLSSAPSTDSTTRTTTIAVAVSVPIVVIALMIASVLFYRYRKRPQSVVIEDAYPVVLPEQGKRELLMPELPVGDYQHNAAELSGEKNGSTFVELPGN